MKRPQSEPWPANAVADQAQLARLKGQRVKDAAGHRRTVDGTWPPPWWLPCVPEGGRG